MTLTTDFELPGRAELEPWLQRALERARAGGADAAECGLSISRGLSVTVRRGEAETVEFHHDRSLSVSVYFGRRNGNASTADLSGQGVAQAVDAACAIARASGEDPCNGLAEAELMARQFPDLDLDHVWPLSTEEVIERARACEAAALAVDPRITQTEGASLDTSREISLLANTHGFAGERRSGQHALGCSAIAGSGEDMQRDHWYTAARYPGELESETAVGRRAGERALARLGARKLGTRQAPVLFVPELARGLFGHFAAAISGSALYRKASFLLDRSGQQVFAPGVRITQQPFIPRAASSAAFDQEGVATRARTLVDGGVLQGYLLGSYSARRLGLQTTGNAGGVFNMVVEPGPRSFEELLADMGQGLVVTELMGQGVNTLTGDYSRGAAGYWVENGALAYPVDEITVAGNLAQMYRNIRAIGNDVDIRGGIRSGSVLIEPMTIAGH